MSHSKVTCCSLHRTDSSEKLLDFQQTLSSAFNQLSEGSRNERRRNKERRTKTTRPCLGIRHVQAFLIFMNIVVIYISRLNVAIAVVAMTDAANTNPDFEEFDWTEKQKAFILSSFYWGYVFTQFPGGFLSKHFGAKITMFGATFCSALLSLVTPIGIQWNDWKMFCAIRVFQGFFQGMLFPCIHEHLAKWSPVEERNRLGAFSHTGIECGIVLAMFLSGMIARSSLGWPGISYVSGGLCIFWCLLWCIFAANNAHDSCFISAEERDYIENSMQRSEDFHKKKVPVPWKAIFTSLPFYALLCARCSEAWGLSTVQAEIPSYLNGVLYLDMKSNALYSSLPFLTMWIFSYIYLVASDLLLKKFSLSTVRKTFNTLAFWIPAAALICIGFLDVDQKIFAICLMTVTMGVNSGATIGSTLNTIDLSPNHAGILMGIVNTIANFIPIITPLVVGFIVDDKHKRGQWQIVFIIASLIFFFGNLFYIIFGTADVQPWDAEDYLARSDIEKSRKSKNKTSTANQSIKR